MNKTWTDKDGKTLLISDMETPHLNACISLIENNNFVITYFIALPSLFNEYHPDYYDEDRYVCVKDEYNAMKTELEKRIVNCFDVIK